MIVITCAHCGKRQLLPLTMVNGMTRTVDDGRVFYHLTYTCWCGRPGIKTIRGPVDVTSGRAGESRRRELALPDLVERHPHGAGDHSVLGQS